MEEKTYTEDELVQMYQNGEITLADVLLIRKHIARLTVAYVSGLSQEAKSDALIWALFRI